MTIQKNWTAGGYANMAKWLGWNPPTEVDGIWHHEEAGSYHDSIMASVVFAYVNRLRHIEATDSLDFNFRMIKQKLMDIDMVISSALGKTQDEPDERVRPLQEIGHHVQRALEQIAHVQFENV